MKGTLATSTPSNAAKHPQPCDEPEMTVPLSALLPPRRPNERSTPAMMTAAAARGTKDDRDWSSSVMICRGQNATAAQDNDASEYCQSVTRCRTVVIDPYK